MDFKDMSDTAVLKELGSRISQSRLNKNMTQGAFAKEVGVSMPTIYRVEHGHSTQTTSLIRILRALNLLENLEALVPEPGISPIQQVKMHGKKRKRASSPSKISEPDVRRQWSWEDDA